MNHDHEWRDTESRPPALAQAAKVQECAICGAVRGYFPGTDGTSRGHWMILPAPPRSDPTAA